MYLISEKHGGKEIAHLQKTLPQREEKATAKGAHKGDRDKKKQGLSPHLRGHAVLPEFRLKNRHSKGTPDRGGASNSAGDPILIAL